MKRFFLGIILCMQTGYSASVEPGDDYVVIDNPKVQLLVAKEYQNRADTILSRANAILSSYEKLYGYKLDDTLYVGLASSRNQIANAFSTQIPLNLQMNYIGGSLMPDYFAATSWLELIQIHESAHNFQLNAKKNPLSRISHEIVKNTPFISLFLVPIFPVPNLIESSFILEGNAVLHESLFGNGGRLYSGAILATVMTQARAGLIEPARSYNDHLFFPYGAHHYFVGGFFQLYLAEKYGLEKTDHYFLTYSNQWLPFFTNAVFKENFGKNFEEELAEYNAWLLQKYKDFTPSQGKKIAFSTSNVSLNSDKNEIYFLTSDARSQPKMMILDKKTAQITVRKTNHPFGKLFKIRQNFYARSSARTSGNKTEIALYDAEGKPKSDTTGQALQCITPDKKQFYFDVQSSIEQPRLFQDGHYLKTVNSSVWCDQKGAIYYFKNSGKMRTLFRNDTALFSYRGYYGKVVDVDSRGRVLFIANSKTGSTLYRYDNHSLQRLCAGDDIIDAKLLRDDFALLEVIRANGIAFITSKLKPVPSKVFEVSYFFENQYHLLPSEHNISKVKPYISAANLHYSALEQSFEFSQDNDVNFNIRADFSDPLMRNSLYLYTSKFDEDTVAGVGYDNSAWPLHFGLDIYGVLHHDRSVRDRGFGGNVYMQYPLYAQTYQRADISLDYHIDSDRDSKSPLSVRLNMQDRKQFGYSFYANSKNSFSLFGVDDRSDLTYGGRYDFMHDLGAQFYAGVGLHYAKSDIEEVSGVHERGILIDHNGFDATKDPSRIEMPSLKQDIYAKEAFKGELSLSKVFDQSAYFFSFPLSLRREAVYGKYRYFNLKDAKNSSTFDEYTLGLTLELLALHKGVVPISFEYLQNNQLDQSSKFRILFALDF